MFLSTFLSGRLIFAFFPLIIIPIVFTVFIILYRNSRKKLHVESGKTPLYEGAAAGWIGKLRYTYPFVNVRLYEDFMVIGYKKSLLIYYKDIEYITFKQYYRVIAKGITIVHSRKDIPERIIVFAQKHSSVIMEFLKTKVKIAE